MHGFLHSLQIGTLSAWLSVAGFGTLGVLVQPWISPPPAPSRVTVETKIIPSDFLIAAPGDPAPSTPGDPATPRQPASPVDSPADPFPSPPELASLPEVAPLPEIPDLPAPPTAPSPSTAADPIRESTRSHRPSATAASPPGPTRSRSSGTGGSGNAPGTDGSGTTPASRLSAGRMPAPSYPPAAKRAGQTGSVTVEFTIGTDGQVLSAHAKSACAWPSLNEAAVRAVRRWKFPPGGVMTTQRRIDFVLN